MADFDETVLEDDFEDEGAAGPGVEPRTSRLAVVALVSSLVCCFPVTSLLGLLLGSIAMIRIGTNPALRGRGAALVAVILGLAGSAAHLYVYRVLTAPARALHAAAAGDVMRFKSFFNAGGAQAPNIEVTTFITKLEDRYGPFVRAWPVAPSEDRSPTDDFMRFEYVFVFRDATQSGEAWIVLSLTGMGKLDSIRVLDDELGELKYPVVGTPQRVSPGGPRGRSPTGSGGSLRNSPPPPDEG